MPYNNVKRAPAFDSSSRATVREYTIGAPRALVTTTTQIEQAIVQGDGFRTYYKGGTIVQGGSAWFYVKTSPDDLFGFRTRSFTADSNNIEYYVYGGASGVDASGSNINIYNMNQVSGIVRSSGTIFQTATRNANPLGPEVDWDFTPGVVNSGNRSSSDTNMEEGFRIYNPSTEFVIEIRNASTTDDVTKFRLAYRWVESPIELLEAV